MEATTRNPFSELSDVTLIKCSTSRTRTNAKGCLWWRTWTRKNVCISSSNHSLGSVIVFIELDSGRELASVKMRQGVAVAGLQLVKQSFAESDCWMIISTVAHG